MKIRTAYYIHDVVDDQQQPQGHPMHLSPHDPQQQEHTLSVQHHHIWEYQKIHDFWCQIVANALDQALSDRWIKVLM